MDQNQERVLHYFSRAVIIVPIVVLVVGLLLRATQKNLNSQSSPTSSPSPTNLPSQTTLKNFDLSKSYICNFQNSQASQSAYIKDKKIYVENLNLKTKVTKFTLYKDDCLYTWEKSKYSGQKTCGLSPYVSILENLSKFNLLNLDTIISTVTNLGLSTSSAVKDNDNTSKKAEAFLNSCTQKEIKSMGLFEVPKNILFKNQKIEDVGK